MQRRSFMAALGAAIPGAFWKLSATRMPKGIVQSPLLIDVRDYGARGDGVVDDTKAFRSAVAAAAAMGGGRLMLAPGSYLITETISLTASIELTGVGQGSRIISRALGASILVEAPGCLLSDFLLEGGRAHGIATSVGIAMERTDQTSCRNVVVREFTDTGIRLTSCMRTLIEQCEVYHIAAQSGMSACGIRLVDGYNNGIWITGGEVHGSSVGVYVGRGATNVRVQTIIEGNESSGLQYCGCVSLLISSYFEQNGMVDGGADIEGLVGGRAGYDDPARAVTIDSSYFYHSPRAMVLRNVAGVQVRNCSAAPTQSGKLSPWVVCIVGRGAQNLHVSNSETLVFQNERGETLRLDEATHLQENILMQSSSLAGSVWASDAMVASFGTDPNSPRFLDGAPALRIGLTSSCNSGNPARITQAVVGAGGRVVGTKIWVMAPTGGSGTIAPFIATSEAVTGSGTNLPHRLRVTDRWAEVAWTAGLPADSESATVGWYLFPDDGSKIREFYIARPQAWLDSIQPPQYVPTGASPTHLRIAAIDVPHSGVG